jgi:chromosome segregation ATPase
MKHERNVEGLRQNAQKKKQEALKRTDAAIQQLNKEGRPINFKAVAEMADVSTAWLYKEPTVKSRIETLREQGTKKQKLVAPEQKATDASKDAKYQALKQRLQKIEAENRGLREHLETIHGRQRALVDENEVQRREIDRLTKLLSSAEAELENFKQQTNSSQHHSDDEKHRGTLLNLRKPSSSKSSQIQSELEALLIKLNPTLKKIVSLTPEEVTLLAIEALKEAQSKGEVPNPEGFLARAIKEGWTPSDAHKNKAEKEIFNEWYKVTSCCGLVSAATKFEGVQHVLTADGEWVPFSQMIARYPLDTLKSME